MKMVCARRMAVASASLNFLNYVLEGMPSAIISGTGCGKSNFPEVFSSIPHNSPGITKVLVRSQHTS
jgi:hypothetical protein